MANGLAPYILQDIKASFGEATPSRKLDMNGLLAVAYNNAKNSGIKTIFADGSKREVRITYRQRPTYQLTDTVGGCTDINVPARLESTVSVGSTRQISYFLSDQLLSTYNSEVLSRQNLPGTSPNVGASGEMIDIFYSAFNAILSGVNRDLIGLLTWGKNVVTGNTAATTLDFPKAASTSNDLAKGEAKLLSDYALNGLTGRPQIVGAGLGLAYSLQQNFKGLNAAGVNTAIAANGWDFYPDSNFASIVGTDNIGVFEPGSIHIVEALEYQGAAGGVFPGDSTFGTIPVPYTDMFGNTAIVMFDFQLRYVTCPGSGFTDTYAGGGITNTKGWQLIIKKDFGLFQTPTNAFRNEDLKFFVNGALRYNVTNS